MLKKETLLNAEQLRVLFKYDPESGIFSWLCGKNTGEIAGSLNCDGYVRISVLGFSYTAHRLAWLYMTGKWPKTMDHKNRVRTDNRWINLRECTVTQNLGNRSPQSNNKLGIKGVVFNEKTGKYKATIRRDHLGYFDTAEAAQEAYWKAAQEIYGEFANA